MRAGGGDFERVPRVKRRTIPGHKKLAVKLVGARLGENFDPSVTDFVVLRGKRILIDADFADGSFGRERPGRKAVYVNLAAVGARGRAGKGLQFGLQLIGIVGERFEVLALHDHHTGVVGRSNIDLGGGIRDFHLFFLDLNDKPDMQLLSLPCKNLEIFLRENREAFGDRFQGVGPRNQSLEFVEALPVGGGID